MKKTTFWRISLPFFMWICSCQGSSPNDSSQDQRKQPSSSENLESGRDKQGNRPRKEIDEIPANLKANLRGIDIFSCVQKTKESSTSEVELCFEVSRSHLGNDDTAIQYAQALCAHNQWLAGKPCPKSGILTSCKGAVLNSGLTYDKYGYKKGLTLEDECLANGGQQVAEMR